MDDAKWKRYLKIDEIKKTKPASDYCWRIPDLDLISQFIDINKKKVLDIGCEQGIMLEEIKKKYECEIYGCTLGDEITDENKSFISYGDMHELIYNDNEFDIVFIMHTLEHSIAPYICLKEINRVLKMGGYIVVIMPEEGDVWTSVKQHYSVLSFRQLFNFLNKTQFEIIKSFRKEYLINDGEWKRDIICIAQKIINDEDSLLNGSNIIIPTLSMPAISRQNIKLSIVSHSILKDGTFNHFLGRTDGLK